MVIYNLSALYTIMSSKRPVSLLYSAKQAYKNSKTSDDENEIDNDVKIPLNVDSDESTTTKKRLRIVLPSRILKGMIILDISIVLMSIIQGTSCINCFKCSSLNGSNVNCEDPFSPGSSRMYIEKCLVPKKGHVGMFPAHFCTKIIGRNVLTHEIMVIRQCAIKTMDSQCGEFRFQDNTMNGCILTCDFDGCNSAKHRKPANTWLSQIAFSAILLAMTSYYVDKTVECF